VFFSCKISNSLINFLEKKGEDLSPLLESTSLPEEFLRDPSYWMSAEEMEALLNLAITLYQKDEAQSFIQTVGHKAAELKSWGVLDSVLRMMPRPQDILHQPERFLSYFISPNPPTDNLKRSESSIEFDVAVSADQYPLVTSYLSSSFECLPVYTGQQLAACSWQGIHLSLSWQQNQDSLFGEEDTGRQISPDLIRNVLSSLEKHSQELEEKNRELQFKNNFLQSSRDDFEKQLKSRFVMQESADFEISKNENNFKIRTESSDQVLQNLARMNDYMVRAQQLITMLVAQDRLNPQVKAAMKRVDWETVKNQFPVLIKECREALVDKGELNV
jgi:hypothetical protein